MSRPSLRSAWTASATIVVVLAIVTAAVVSGRRPREYAFRVVERYEFAETAPGAALALAIAVPTCGPYQDVTEPQVVWGGTYETSPDRAACTLWLTGTSDASGRAVAEVAYELTVKVGEARWSGAVEPADLGPSRFVESDAPAVRQQASSLATGTTREDAFRIFCFASRHVRWQQPHRFFRDGLENWGAGEQSALRTLETGKGGCGEFANLTVALLRAAGIPARTISGLAFPRMAGGESRTAEWNHPAGSHGWVEFHADGAWELADPSWVSDEQTDEGRRRWFGRNDGSHLAYGTADEDAARFDAMRAWARRRGREVAAMSAPIRAVAAVDGKEGRCTPSVTLTRLTIAP
jgi:transglutaminase-like putative cysteine protease